MNFDNEYQPDQSATSWSSGSEAATTPKSNSSRLREKAADEAGEKLAAEMKVFNQVAAELRAKLDASLPFGARCKLVTDTAAELFGVAPTWTAFYREMIGGGGIARSLFSDAAESQEYECSDAHGKVLEMLTALRSRDLPENDPHEPQRMITVRIPKSLHDAICEEANALTVSVNKLCISRMLQKIDLAMIPTSSQKRRGRRPGAANVDRSAAETADSNRQSTDDPM
jgi:predicted HicB family RNase H-like nuclease